MHPDREDVRSLIEIVASVLRCTASSFNVRPESRALYVLMGSDGEHTGGPSGTLLSPRSPAQPWPPEVAHAH